MDKLLESKFILAGGRSSAASNVAIMSEDRNANHSRSQEKIKPMAEARLPGLFRPSSTGGPMPSGFDSESTYSDSKKSRDDAERDLGEAPESNNDEVDVAAIAYFVEASGRIVPVDIHPDEQPISRIGSVYYQRIERYPAATYEMGEEEQEERREFISPEQVFDRAWGAGHVHTDQSSLAEQEAIFADLAPAWMQERPGTDMR